MHGFHWKMAELQTFSSSRASGYPEILTSRLDVVSFLVRKKEDESGKNPSITIVYKPLPGQSGLYIESAPVEEKGYMNIINRPEYHETRNNSLKMKNLRRIERFFLPHTGSFF
jgi:hypothetical protein